MLPKISKMNLDMLIWAREQSIGDMRELDTEYAEQISKWEKGIEFPNYPELKELARLYRKPLAIFFFPEPPEIKNIKSSYRTYQGDIYNLLSINTIRMVDYCRFMQLNLIDLYGGENPNIQSFRFLKSQNLSGKEIRKYLDFPIEKQKAIKSSQEMFNIWRDALYSIGIYVFKQAFKDESVSGLCLDDENFPLILINNSTSLNRQIFTLFHELCHLLHGTSGLDLRSDESMTSNFSENGLEIEYACNQFAADFLVPDEAFLNSLKGKTVDYNLICNLAQSYNVSREVINRKLHDLEFIPFAVYEQNVTIFYHDYFRTKDTNAEDDRGGNYYNTQSTYLGKQYLSQVYTRYYTKQITIEKLSRYLNMTIANASNLADKKGWGSL